MPPGQAQLGTVGRQGSAGAMNLIDGEKRKAAAALVQSGRTVSLSRPWTVTPSVENPLPAAQYMKVHDLGHGKAMATDYLGVSYHGDAHTHIDALCHVWDSTGMWGGRDPAEVMGFDGAKYGSVEQWSGGILTRGLLLDVPKYRGKPYVDNDEPVLNAELDDILEQHDLEVQPGERGPRVQRTRGLRPGARGTWGGRWPRPGLHSSCLLFVHDNDISMLGWDMMGTFPDEYEILWGMHSVLFAFGVALLDNSLLQPLAEACAEERRYEFMLSVNPLNIPGATGSPVNPIAVF